MGAILSYLLPNPLGSAITAELTAAKITVLSEDAGIISLGKQRCVASSTKYCQVLAGCFGIFA